MHPWRCLTLVLVCGLALFAPDAPAQQPESKTPPAAPENKLGSAQETPRQETAKRPAESPDPFVIEQSRTRVRFEDDGTGSRTLEVHIRVRNEAGAQQLGRLVFGYDASRERLEIESVEVQKPGGGMLALTASAVRDATAVTMRDFPAYADVREKRVAVPALAPGDLLSYRVTRTIYSPPAPGQFWLSYDFVEDAPVLDEQLEVNVPAARAVTLKTHSGAEPDVTEESGQRIYRWKRAQLHRAESEKAGPAVGKEESPGPAVQLTTFQSWEELGRWYAGQARERAAPTDAVRARASELIRERASDLEKIEAIYDFVTRDVRTISLSLGEARYQPRAATEILVSGYGDAQDKHTLLAALLDAAGYPAYPVLLHSARAMDAAVPSPAQLDHLISVVPLGADSRQWVWLDSTIEVAPFRMLPSRLRGKQALVIPISKAADAPPPRLIETPQDPPFLSRQGVMVEAQVSAQGKLTARVRYALRGDAELDLREAFRRLPREQWKQIGQLLAYSDGFRGEVDEVSASDPRATRDPFEVSYHLIFANCLNVSQQNSRLALPLPAVGLPEAAEDSAAPPGPVELGAPLEVRARLVLELPPGYTARPPVAVRIARDYAEYAATYRVERNRLIAERTMTFRMREVPAARVADYHAFIRALRLDEAQTLMVEKTASVP